MKKKTKKIDLGPATRPGSGKSCFAQEIGEKFHVLIDAFLKGDLPQWYVDPLRPGIVHFDNDPLSGILAGSKAAEIVHAVNNYPKLLGALKLALQSREIDGDASAIATLITAGRAAVKAAEGKI